MNWLKMMKGTMNRAGYPKRSAIFRRLVAVAMLTTFAQSLAAQTYVRQGRSQYGEVLCNWDGRYIRQGRSAYGEVLYNWDGKYIRQGRSQYGEVLYNWDGRRLRQGRSAYGAVLLNVSGSIPIPVLMCVVGM